MKLGNPKGKMERRPTPFHICEIGVTLRSKVDCRFANTILCLYILCCPQIIQIPPKKFMIFSSPLSPKCKPLLKINFLPQLQRHLGDSHGREPLAFKIHSGSDLSFYPGSCTKRQAGAFWRILEWNPQKNIAQRLKGVGGRHYGFQIWALWSQISYFLRHSFFVYRMGILIHTVQYYYGVWGEWG